MSKALVVPFLIFILCGQSQGRSISDHSSSSDLVSDGLDDLRESRQQQWSSYLGLHSDFGAPEESTCEQSYGFLPCTTTALGNLFLIIIYGYLMFMAATYLSNGSELLLEILGPGIVGGLFLPILGALPDAMLILVSGLSGSSETAQSQVSVGMGLLAGSTVLLLTVIWGTCVIVGKCDIEGPVARDGRDTKGFSLTGSGVSTDIWTSYAARIMAISVLPFLIVQLPQLLNSTSGRHIAVLIALIVSVLLLVSYCLYQVFQPWIQKRRLDYAKHKHVISGILQHLHMRGLGKLLDEDGEPNKSVIEKLFDKIDENHDGHLSAPELRALIIGIRFDEIDFDRDDAVEKVMKDFDTTSDSYIDKDEFIAGLTKWLIEAKCVGDSYSGHGGTKKFLSDFHMRTKQEHDLLGPEDQSEEAVEGVADAKWITLKAALMLLLGAAIAAAFADPLVDAVDNFSSATSIPTFFISFIALPFATNSSEAVSAIIFATRKKKRTASLTFSEVTETADIRKELSLDNLDGVELVISFKEKFSLEIPDEKSDKLTCSADVTKFIVSETEQKTQVSIISFNFLVPVFLSLEQFDVGPVSKLLEILPYTLV